MYLRESLVWFETGIVIFLFYALLTSCFIPACFTFAGEIKFDSHGYTYSDSGS